MTVVESLLIPDYCKKYNLQNTDEVIEICKSIKKLEEELLSQLDTEHRHMLKEYNKLWDNLHGCLSVETFISGVNFKG